MTQDYSWPHIVHDVLNQLPTITAGVAAVIAAVSSLKNGKTLKNRTSGSAPANRVAGKDQGKAKRTKEQSNDWYEPPDLGK